MVLAITILAAWIALGFVIAVLLGRGIAAGANAKDPVPARVESLSTDTADRALPLRRVA